PVLHSYPLPEEWMPSPRNVAGGEYVRHGGLKPLVDDHTVVDSQPGVLGKRDPRYDADPDDDEVAVDRPATGGAHARHRAVAFERFDAVAEQQLDAMLSVDVAIEGPDLRTEDPLAGQRQGVDHGHLEPPLAGGGGELATDPTRAYHHHVPAGIDPLTQLIAVGQRAQVVHALQVRAGHREPPWLRPGRQQQAVEPALSTVGERDPRCAGVERGHRGAGQQVDLVPGVEVRLVDVG